MRARDSLRHCRPAAMMVRCRGAPPLALAVLCALISFTHAFLPSFQLRGLRQQPALGLDRQVCKWTHGTHAPRRRLLPVMMDSEADAEEEKRKLNEAEQLVQMAKKATAEAEAAKQKALDMKNSALGELAATARKYNQQQEASKLAVMADETEKTRSTTDVDKSVKSLINDRSLESKFVEIPKNADIPGEDEKDEDAAFGLPGSVIRAIKNGTWACIALLVFVEVWARSPLSEPVRGKESLEIEMAKKKAREDLDKQGLSLPGVRPWAPVGLTPPVAETPPPVVTPKPAAPGPGPAPAAPAAAPSAAAK